jgi:septum formation protein
VSEVSGHPNTGDLVLASTSPYRRALLERLGVPFRCVAPRFDESSVSKAGIEPRELAETLARGKADSIAVLEPAATVIGCDQIVSFEGGIYGKPASIEGAVAQLQAMAGRTHELITALVVIRGAWSVCHTDVTRMHMRALSRAEIERYVAQDRPLDCAGSYKLEERGIVLFEGIKTGDHTAITGLPLIALATVLRQLGFAIP